MTAKSKTRDSTLARALYHARGVAGLTQADLAARLGVSCKTVERYERGDSFPAEPAVQLRVGEFLGLTIEDVETLVTTSRPDAHSRAMALDLARQVRDLRETAALLRDAVESFDRVTAKLEALEARLARLEAPEG